MNSRGFFGIGVENIKTEQNFGTLFRSALILGAEFIFTINRRYQRQASDTVASFRHMPLYHYPTFEDFYEHIPYNCRLVGIELAQGAFPLESYTHPDQCVYLLGSEDNGLTSKALNKWHHVVILPGSYCLNVSVAGSIVMYDRLTKNIMAKEVAN